MLGVFNLFISMGPFDSLLNPTASSQKSVS